jgi:23S rRNA (guanine745-N1)-methyltransferase
MSSMLAEIRAILRCPLCTGELSPVDGGVRCPRGHTFDQARQGYLNLLTGRAPAGAETPAMVQARAALLDAGHFGFLRDAVVALAAAPSGSGLVVDAGAGTGYYLAAVLDALTDHLGLALDVAKAAVRRAARAHPRAGAAVCDVWRGLPLADRRADLILNIFAPRNAEEFHRVLRPDGAVIVVTPGPDHLHELVSSLGLIGIDPEKDRRLDETLGRTFALDHEATHGTTLRLDRDTAGLLVAMGPSAWHIDPAVLRALPDTVDVTARVTLRRYRPR